MIAHPPTPTMAPAVHICHTCAVSWRDHTWGPSPCWSCDAPVPVSSTGGLFAPVQTGYHNWQWTGPLFNPHR